ncbi:carbohydrate porin [Roseiarcus sp.]|uniref:carbohydrate porin n=1 Tax=Roseiarcus sp. TaxID=1969460 RepID=UPI003F9A518C
MALVSCSSRRTASSRPRPRPSALSASLAAAGLFAALSPSASADELALPILTPAPFFAPTQDYWNTWTQTHFFGDLGGLRPRLHDLGVDLNIQGVDEALANLSGGLQRTVQEAGQVALQVRFDLQKIIGLEGGSFGVTLVDRWGRNFAADAGIPALQLINEVYGRGNIVRLEEFKYKQHLFDDRLEITLGRLAFGDEFFSFSCDFINLTFCGAPPGNIVGNYIYNWPVSQWAAVGKLNLPSDVYLKAAVYDSNPAYLDTSPNIALLPSVPADSQGAIVPVELGWTPKFGALMGEYKVGGWTNSSAAPNVATSLNGEPILVSGLPGLPGHGRYGFSTELQQQLTHDSANADPRNGLYAFFNATYADRRTSAEDYQVALGLFQQGVGARPKDGFGVTVGTTHVNPNIANAQAEANSLGVGPGYVQHNEYATEAWYGWQATGWMNLKFDAQYVICPGGYTTPTDRNAFVLGIRTTVDF